MGITWTLWIKIKLKTLFICLKSYTNGLEDINFQGIVFRNVLYKIKSNRTAEPVG